MYYLLPECVLEESRLHYLWQGIFVIIPVKDYTQVGSSWDIVSFVWSRFYVSGSLQELLLYSFQDQELNCKYIKQIWRKKVLHHLQFNQLYIEVNRSWYQNYLHCLLTEKYLISDTCLWQKELNVSGCDWQSIHDLLHSTTSAQWSRGLSLLSAVISADAFDVIGEWFSPLLLLRCYRG